LVASVLFLADTLPLHPAIFGTVTCRPHLTAVHSSTLPRS